jgi:hypothetical protein
MKKIIQHTVIGLIALAVCSCSKTSGSSNSSTTGPNQWTLKGTTYTGLSIGYNDTTSGLGVLVSAAAGGNTLTVIFYSHPATNGAFMVTNGGVTAPGTQCMIQVGVYKNNAYDIYTSTGKTGDQVNLTISGGKVKVSFTNITVSDNATTATVSGNLAQQ